MVSYELDRLRTNHIKKIIAITENMINSIIS